MKRVLVIEGGARRNQNTDVLSNYFIDGAKENGNEVEKIYINQANIHGCIGCNMCRSKGSCVFDDDAKSINEKILKADVIVMTSPVYWYSVTSQLKAVIDRTYAIEQSIKDKDIYFIATCAAPYEAPYADKLERAVDVIRGYADCFDDSVTFQGYVIGDGFTKENAEQHHATKDAYEMGKRV